MVANGVLIHQGKAKSPVDLENKVRPKSGQIGLMTNNHHWWFKGTFLGIKVSVGAVLRSPLMGTGLEKLG